LAQTLPDQELAEKVSALVQRGHLDRGDPAYGVALAAIDLGYERLTRAQKRLYDRLVAPALAALAAGTLPAATVAPIAAPAAPKPARAVPRSVEAGDGWKPIREAPDDRDVQLATMVGGAPSALAFACRRENRTWVNAATRKPIYIRPSHWREWPG
jgi:hypothetical protein